MSRSDLDHIQTQLKVAIQSHQVSFGILNFFAAVIDRFVMIMTMLPVHVIESLLCLKIKEFSPYWLPKGHTCRQQVFIWYWGYVGSVWEENLWNGKVHKISQVEAVSCCLWWARCTLKTQSILSNKGMRYKVYQSFTVTVSCNPPWLNRLTISDAFEKTILVPIIYLPNKSIVRQLPSYFRGTTVDCLSLVVWQLIK